MKKISLFILVLVNFFFLSFALDNGSIDYWKTLEGVKVKHSINPETEEFDTKFIFSKKIKKLEGQTIQLKGFIITYFSDKNVLSKSEFYTFGCGGPRYGSTIECVFKDSIKFYPEKSVVLEGTLRLNADDPFRQLYILENARCLDCK
jgi:hypothetical protein